MVFKPPWGCSESRCTVNAGICNDVLLNSNLRTCLNWNRAMRIIDYEPNKQCCSVSLQACVRRCHYDQVFHFLGTWKYTPDIARRGNLKHLAIGMVPFQRWKYWAVGVNGFIFYPGGNDCVHSAVTTKISVYKHWNIIVSLFGMMKQHRGKGHCTDERMKWMHWLTNFTWPSSEVLMQF